MVRFFLCTSLREKFIPMQRGEIGKPRRDARADKDSPVDYSSERRDGALAKMTSFLFLFYPKT